MSNFKRLFILSITLLLISCIFSCEKEKQGKVVITGQEFILRQDGDHSYVVDARGTVKNVGEVDVKKVVVTGYCRSCSEIWVVGQWLASVTEKIPEQKDVISYLPVGEEEEFSLKRLQISTTREIPPRKCPKRWKL